MAEYASPGSRVQAHKAEDLTDENMIYPGSLRSGRILASQAATKCRESSRKDNDICRTIRYNQENGAQALEGKKEDPRKERNEGGGGGHERSRTAWINTKVEEGVTERMQWYTIIPSNKDTE